MSNERTQNEGEARKDHPSETISRPTMLEIKAVRMELPADANIIVGQSHFIKTVEDLYEAVATTVPQAKFGLAFNESSGSLSDAVRRKRPNASGYCCTQRSGTRLRPHVCGDTAECVPHQCDECDPKRA